MQLWLSTAPTVSKKLFEGVSFGGESQGADPVWQESITQTSLAVCCSAPGMRGSHKSPTSHR